MGTPEARGAPPSISIRRYGLFGEYRAWDGDKRLIREGARKFRTHPRRRRREMEERESGGTHT